MVSPLIRRRRLARELRALREAAGLTAEALARKAGTNRSKISRVETADRVPSVSDVTMILDALGVTGNRWHELVQVAKDAGERGWWSDYGAEMGARQAVYADLEHGATTIREYASFVVPGLLQIPEYTQARAELSRLQELFPPKHTDRAVTRSVEAKSMRQRMLRRPDGPRYEALVDETAILRPAALPEVMARQLTHLADLAENDDRVNMRILPQRATIGDFWLPRSPFTLYTFADGDPDAAVVDTEVVDLVYTDATDVVLYHELYRRLAEAALSGPHTVALLREEAARYKGDQHA